MIVPANLDVACDCGEIHHVSREQFGRSFQCWHCDRIICVGFGSPPSSGMVTPERLRRHAPTAPGKRGAWAAFYGQDLYPWMTETWDFVRTMGWKWRTVVFALLFAVAGWWCWSNSHSEVILCPHGKAIFFRGGLFHRDKFELTKDQGKWRFSRSEPLESGELAVPFECPYNEHRTLRLEDGGKAYTLDKRTMTREELRVVEGEWSYDASDHWQSIFDPDY